MLSLFATFFRVGSFSFGGGYGMLPLIRREVVERRRWIREEEFLELLTLAQTAPGPISLNIAVSVGYSRKGYLGALSALLGVVLPAFGIILAIALLNSTETKQNPHIEAIFKGLRPAVVALMAAPLWNLVRKLKKRLTGVTILSAAAIAIWKFGVSPILLLTIGAIWGAIMESKKSLPQKS